MVDLTTYEDKWREKMGSGEDKGRKQNESGDNVRRGEAEGERK